MAQDSFAFRSALWKALNEGLLNDVYSQVPQNAEFPYVAVGEIYAENIDSKSGDALEYDVTLHIWEKNTESSLMVELLFAEIQEILNDGESNIVVDGYKVVYSRLQSQRILQFAYESGAAGASEYMHGIQYYTVRVDYAGT